MAEFFLNMVGISDSGLQLSVFILSIQGGFVGYEQPANLNTPPNMSLMPEIRRKL